jgi:MFS family permease
METTLTTEQFIIKRNKDISQSYSFSSVLIMAFCRCCSLTLLGLGLPNYLIFDLGESSLTAGLTITAFCIPYSILPFFLSRLTDKLGRKRTLIYSVIGINLSLIVYFFPINATIAIISRFFEGAFTSFFWPMLQATISDVKNYDPNYEKRISHYNLSWNSGALFGYIIGAFAVYIIESNEISFLLSVLFSILILPVVLLLKLPSKEVIDTFQNSNDKFHIYMSEYNEKSNHNTPKPTSNKRNNEFHQIQSGSEDEHILSHVNFIIPVFLILLHSGIMGSIFIIISTKFNGFGFPSYLTYILSFARMFISLIAIFLLEKIKNHKIPIAAFIIGLIYSIPPLIFAYSLDITVYIIFCGVLGFTSISIYTFAAKICLDKNAVNKTSKYSGYFEGFMGIGSGLGPLIVGIGSDINFDFTFILMGIYGLILTCAYFYLFKKKTNL